MPLGWGLGRGVGDTLGAAWDGIWAAPFDLWVRKLLGWGLTAGALTLGAPFWFDLLF